MSAIPTIETARLRLRPPVEADFDSAAAFLAGPRARFVGGPYAREAAWRAFAACVGGWILQGFGYWAVEERTGGALAGAVGFIGRPIFPEIELGWDLYEARFEGRGYATEAAEAARGWAFGTGLAGTLISVIHPENARSIRVAERLGAARDRSVAAGDPEDVVYRHAPPGGGP